MNKFYWIFLLFFSFKTMAVEVEFNPMIAVGHRFGEDNLNDKNEFYGSFKVTLLKQDLNSFNSLNFLTTAVNFQGDSNLSLSISPISITMLNGITFGVDLFYKEKNVNGGPVGVFAGFRF